MAPRYMPPSQSTISLAAATVTRVGTHHFCSRGDRLSFITLKWGNIATGGGGGLTPLLGEGVGAHTDHR